VLHNAARLFSKEMRACDNLDVYAPSAHKQLTLGISVYTLVFKQDISICSSSYNTAIGALLA
jgi:hypothetical protein